ncbi:pyridoxal 4-dehydrogenase [Sphingobium jiangsuense]|uniref:NAD(P)-dependent dehydrogenase (Short-subunit alcohol dehydrogenase family) n=1 Tax=Sphingobium jiangsuense TaxID=870476 RepID=A0A7W6BLW9_9SPHN|nr:SDR family NAD(P)-dependent oxidoreductase [Sphingobium jiangsuense]MBB3927381.1 NAD(P)-dependent dehydrogenase (short-subunit alcohol dehydrogenase family) [Sphingobium jiangsuense]GLT00783.1 pyridoxal 4-dehydrogenase [Sphingobium jiangsuense]
MTAMQKTAIVTGAATGLGAAYARRLAQDGFRVALVDIGPTDAVAAQIEAAGGKARGYACDLRDPARIAATVEAIDAEMGGGDVLVNNAGVYDFTPHESVDLELWRRIMSLNVDGMFLMTQAVIPGMKTKGWGRIINVASNSCFIPPAGLTAYVASKSASIGYVRALAGELGQYGITVNAIAPGPTVTGTTRGAFPDEESFLAFMQGFVKDQAVKQISYPEHSAPVVSFFASEGAAFVSGQTLVVDGGHAKH